MANIVKVELPIRAESLNKREHHMAKARRVKSQREIARFHMKHVAKVAPPSLPLHLILTRIAPRPVDRWDNLPGSCKPVIDGLCEWLGIDDADPLLTIEFKQEQAKDYRVRVEFQPTGETV